MGFAFNPFTGNFDAKGSGGGGASYIDGEVATYSDLPLDGTAPLNSAWLVREASGIWPVSRKQAGIYIRTATAGSSRDADYTYAGTMPDVFSDANFTLYDNADSTKNLQFQLSGISTGTTRTLTVPNASGTLGWLQSVSSITVSTDHQLTAARNQRVRVNSTASGSGASVYLPATNNAEGDRLEVACVGLAAGTLSVRTGQYDFTVSVSMGLNEQRTFIYTAGAWTVGTVESHTHAGLGPTFASSAFQVTEPSGITTNRLAFSLSGLTAGATRTLTVPDASGTIALTSNFAAPPAIGSTTPNTVAATDLSASNKLSLPSAAAASPTAGDLYRNANTIRYRDGTNTERLLLNATDNLSNLANTATARANLGLGTAATANLDALSDSAFRIADNGDATKKLAFELSGISTGTVRTLTVPDASGTIALLETLPAGGSKTYAVFTAEHNQPPATAFATLDTRNSIAVLDFDAATDENAVFVGIMPEAASLGSGLIVRLHWMSTNQTSGNVRWGVQFERSNTDLDADSFDTAVEANGAANTTQSGILTTTAITVTTIDGITAGDVFRLKVFRNADDATNDTMTGDAELVAVEVRSAA